VTLTAIGALVATAVAIGAVAEASSSPDAGSGGGGFSSPTQLDSQFAAAAKEFGVPQSVLMAVSYQETLWETHGGQPSATGNYNVMGLTDVQAADVETPSTSEKLTELKKETGDSARGRRDAAPSLHPSKRVLADIGAVPVSDPTLHTLDAAAALIHKPAADLRTDPQASVRGGAALLASYEKTLTGGLPSDPGQWYAAVARYAQSPDPNGAKLFAGRVFDTVRSGASRTTADGELVVLPADPGVAPKELAPSTPTVPAPALPDGTSPSGSASGPASAAGSAPDGSGTAGTGASDPASAGASAAASAPASTDAGTPADGGGSASPAAGGATASDAAAATGADIVPAGYATSLAPETVPAAWTAECPSTLSCLVKPADDNNFDVADRPSDGDQIDTIVIHDTEGGYAGTVSQFQDPSAGTSAHYVVRSSDGQVTQMVQDKDVAIHAGNKYTNMHAIGIENEGYAYQGATWYTESEYASTAALVKYIAAKYGIPLDRQHIIGHDEVPGPIDSYVSGMHWDPGPYWDWNHFMSLVGAPVTANAAGAPLTVGEAVTFSVPFTSANEPTVVDCSWNDPCATMPAQAADFEYLYTGASTSDAKITDPYDGAGTTTDSDTNDRITSGESYVVAALSGDWTAIWYDGQKAWFYNPHGAYTRPAPAGTTIVESASGTAAVYGRAYPESSAYPSGITVQSVTPFSKYTLPAGQEYVANAPVYGDFYDFETAGVQGTFVRGTTQYYPIRYGHRLAYVQTSAATTVATTAPPAASTRWNLLATDSGGKLWQYQGRGSATTPFLSRYQAGTGWQGYNALVALDGLRADASSPLVARDSSGVLWWYSGSGNPASPFKARVKIGSGWQIYNTVVGVGDVTGDGKADLVARDSAGKLWLYQGTGSTTAPFKARVQIGTGWQIYNTIVGVGDLSGDGKPDLIGRDSSGKLWLYTGRGSATTPFAARVQIGTGWQIYNTIIGTRDLNEDGKADLVGRDSSGNLWLYQGTGSATAPYKARVEVGTGWQNYKTIL